MPCWRSAQQRFQGRGALPGPACRPSDASVSAAVRKPSSRSSRVISRTVRPLPHQWTASRSDKPSSSVIVRSACPARCSASGRERRVHRARSALRLPDPRSGVPGRRVLCAVPPGHLTLSVAPPASPIADSSHLPYRHRSFIDTGLSFSRKQLRGLERSHRRSRSVSRTPSRFQDPLFDTPDAPKGSRPGRADRVGGCTPFGWV
jgi:hypothetical protein